MTAVVICRDRQEAAQLRDEDPTRHYFGFRQCWCSVAGVTVTEVSLSNGAREVSQGWARWVKRWEATLRRNAERGRPVLARCPHSPRS